MEEKSLAERREDLLVETQGLIGSLNALITKLGWVEKNLLNDRGISVDLIHSLRHSLENVSREVNDYKII